MELLLQLGEQVVDGENRMFPEHTWPCVTHDLLNLATHIWFVTVYGTLTTGWFCFTKAAVVQTLVGVMQKCLALCTKTRWGAGAVMLLTV